MKKLLLLAAAGEAATGLALLLVPSLVALLLFGVELTGVSVPIARVTGIALMALGIGCLTTQTPTAMLTYGMLVTLYLAYVGVRGEWVGILLWPAASIHAVLTSLLAWAWIKDRRKINVCS